MVATLFMMRPSIGMPIKIGASIINLANRRTLAISSRPINLKNLSVSTRPSTQKPNVQRLFRRSYADNATPNVRRRAGFFRWTWRLIYLSAIGATGYLGYTVYLLRTPHEQFEPDPSKKTLVILGVFERMMVDAAIANDVQVPAGALSRFSRNSTRRTTM